MGAIVRAQRTDHLRRQRSRQQALGHFGRDQDEHAVAAVLVTAAIPRDSRPAERFPHGTVEALTNRHLVPVSTSLIPEPLNINHDDGPVNGKPQILYPSPPREDQAERKLQLIRKPISGLTASRQITPPRNQPEPSPPPGTDGAPHSATATRNGTTDR